MGMIRSVLRSTQLKTPPPLGTTNSVATCARRISKRNVLMRFILALTVVIMLLGTLMAAPTESKVRRNYELYSWRDANRNWNFALLPHTNRNHSAEEVFGKKDVIHGVGHLKEKLAKLPRGTTVFWPRGIEGIPSDQFQYPPHAIVDELQIHARAHHIRLDIEGPMK